MWVSIMELYGSLLSLLHICCSCVAWRFSGTPNSGGKSVSVSFACSWDPLSPAGLPCPALMWGCVSYLTAFCYATFWLISQGGLLFSEGKWKSSGYGGVRRWLGLGGMVGGEVAVWIYCMREIFQKRLFDHFFKLTVCLQFLSTRFPRTFTPIILIFLTFFCHFEWVRKVFFHELESRNVKHYSKEITLHLQRVKLHVVGCGSVNLSPVLSWLWGFSSMGIWGIIEKVFSFLCLEYIYIYIYVHILLICYIKYTTPSLII